MLVRFRIEDNPNLPCYTSCDITNSTNVFVVNIPHLNLKLDKNDEIDTIEAAT